ncbi:hypothetical protein UFOVP543_37 [uncultured Caudovirales phage]|uniref:Uncharacterized protein n=1 Tax=uncultured Caudovirales phage TaxID=2100421 RepID=A0A6J5MSM5_9CAUD|nr:hypothetical protein UFOVP543_37 [uncultured Caudovirales phage]CAB4163394.1 hypothetical protein UFOVP804_13 [uncultured Caudovirales phage]
MIIGLTGFAFKGLPPSYPPAGTFITAVCASQSDPNVASQTYYDANGTAFTGGYDLWEQYHDGYGGSYWSNFGTGASNSPNACYLPYGFYTNNNSGYYSVTWSACGSYGNFGPTGEYYEYSYSTGGGNFESGSGNQYYNPPANGDVIYDGGCCVVYYDGYNGYYTSDTCNPCPAYGEFVRDADDTYVEVPDGSGNYFFDGNNNVWLADGNCGEYFYYSGLYSSGTYITSSGGYDYYWNGSGGYYESGGCPGSGQLVGTICISTNGTDARGTYFDAAWQYGEQYTDGSCGTYDVYLGTNGYGCYYPAGWYHSYDTTDNGSNTWYVQDSSYAEVASGTYQYSYSWNAYIADGYGNSNNTTGSVYSSYGDFFEDGTYYDPALDQYWYYAIYSDGGSGYYVSKEPI